MPLDEERAAGATRWRVAAAAALVLVGGLAFGNSLRGAFVFDDIPSILENPTCTSPSSIWAAFQPPAGRTVSGRPLVNASLAANYALGQTDVLGYHVLNLTIHLLAGLVLWLVAWRTLQHKAMPAPVRAGAPWLAAAAAAVWVVHPLQTESVSYVVQRAESIAALFSLLALYCTIAAAQSGRSYWTVGAIASCALAMASKETAAVTPLLVLLYDRLFLAGSWRAALRQRRELYAGLAATWGVLAVLILTGGRLGSSVESAHADRWAYLSAQPAYILQYLRLAFWPDALVFDYGDNPAITPYPAAVATSVVVALLAATGLALRYCPPLGFAGVWFFAQLAPSSSVVPIVTQVGAEHRVYLALAGVVVPVVVLLYAGVIRVLAARAARWAAALGLAAALIALVMVTRARNLDYASPVAIWLDTARKLPANPRGWHNLSVALDREGDRPGALEAVDAALRLRPDADAYIQRGNLYQRLDRLPEAEADYQQAVAAGSNRARLYFHLGLVSRALGKPDQALAAYNRAIELDPQAADAYFNRANVLADRGQLEPAVADYSRAIERDPGFSGAYTNRAVCYIRLGQRRQAIADLSRALQLQPQRLDLLNGRARLYVALADFARAEADLDRLVRAGGRADPQVVEAIRQWRARSPGQQ
jgi:tetratricopeptide (TPR) repeat protein